MEVKTDNTISCKDIAKFIGAELHDKLCYREFGAIDYSSCEGFYDTSWDWLMPIIDKINNLGKEYNFTIHKTYCSCSVEKGGKVYKDFSFAHSEIKYVGKEIEAAYKLVVKFLTWYNTIKPQL